MSEEHVEVEAVVTNRVGTVEVVYCGSQPKWTWDLDRCAAWRKMMRKMLLADRTSDPRGWRVVFRPIEETP